MKITKKQGAVIGTVGAVAVATVAGILHTSPIEIPYSLEAVNQYVTELKIDMPEEENVDLVKLYCNGEYVANGMLPDDGIKSIPLVYSDLDNLSLEMYNHGQVVGKGEFKDDKLIYKGAIGK